MAKKKKSKDAGGEEAAPAPPQPPPPKEPVDPKWVWPPFPPPPDGTRIIPFSEFVPKGIVISIDDDQAEHDAEGIPTIELLVKHGAASRKKSKKKKDPFADISEEELRKMTWDKRWELGEEMRTGRPLEPSDMPEDRFEESTKLFREARPWDHTRQEIWDQWRLYVGIISGVKNPFGKKTPKYPIDDERPLAEDPGPGDFSEEDPMEAEVAPPDLDAQLEPPTEDQKLDPSQERYQRLMEAREERSTFWVKETEKATKIYFSSYFRDKGLMWSQPYTRDGPLLLRFYLQFVLRNKLFNHPSEKQLVRGYERALAVVERAIDELPYTFKISRAFPEEWGKGCSSLWGEICVINYGRSYTTYMTESKPAPDASDILEPHVNDEEPEGLSKLVAAEYHDLGDKGILEKGPNEQPEENAADAILEEATIEEVNADEPTTEMITEANVDETTTEIITEVNVDETTTEMITEVNADEPTVEIVTEVNKPEEITESEEVIKPEEVTEPEVTKPEEVNKPEEDDAGDDISGWGADAERGDLVKEWGTPLDSESGWAIAEFRYPTICSFVGPSTLPLNFTPIRAEVSTRILIDIRQPDPSSSDPLVSRLATLVLTPWPKPNDDPDALVRPPEMWDFGKDDSVTMASRQYARRFDPNKDNISVYVDPEAVASCKIGLGIGAAWIQVGKLVEGDAIPSKSSKKGSSDEWWYMERLDFVVPSFWTVNEKHRDLTRPENHPDYAFDFSD